MSRRPIWIVTALTVASITALGTNSQPAGAATPPAGFTDTFVASIARATAVEWLPSDQIVALEQGTGRVRVAAPGQQFTTALDLAVCSNSERGLLGLTADPAFLGNGWVYVYYTAPAGNTCANRVSRFTMTGAVINPGSELILLDNIASTGGNHNGGDLDIDGQGNLLVAIGDAGRDPRGNSGSAGSNDAAQDLSLLNGKIVRITRSGSPAPGNPFTGAGSSRCAFTGTSAPSSTRCQEIYAFGLRNPYRIAVDRNDGAGTFFINDVGQNTFEEVNESRLGANYGWPSREGSCSQGSTSSCGGPPAGVTDPITTYGRGLGSYITAGAFVPNGLWPTVYDDAYLFGDGGSGQVWIRHGDGSVDYGSPFATGAFGLTDMTFGFDTDGVMALYYVQVGGDLRMIKPDAAPASLPPDGLTFYPALEPERVYDTQNGTGAAAGDILNGTTRRVRAAEPLSGVEAALVNITIANSAGPGFARTWHPRGARPGSSTVNVDRAGDFVANAAVVPLDDNGDFIVEVTTTARVVVDVMGVFRKLATDNDNGRFVPIEPIRIADTREPAGSVNDPDADNVFLRSDGDITVYPFGSDGVPEGEPAAAAVLSIGAIADAGPGGFVGAYRPDLGYSGTSNVNVLPGDIRANMVVAGLEPGTGAVGLRTLNIADVVVDLVGYFTDGGASQSDVGLFSFVDQERVVDTRDPLGFGRLGASGRGSVALDANRGAVVQNVTVTGTSRPGWVATYPNALPVISTLNFTGTGQTRAALAFTPLAADGTVRYASLVPTDLVVDVVGYFSD